MLAVYSLAQAEQWDAIVRSFQQYDTYWLSGYVKAFQLHGDGEPLLFYSEDTKRGCRGINVVMKRDIALDKRFNGMIPTGQYFDFATPYGYGGWLIEGPTYDTLFDDYAQWCNRNAVISEFVRFHPLLMNHTGCASYYDVVPLGEVVHMDLSSPECIWENIISKNRNMIRKAQKNDVKVYNGRSPEVFESFRHIYNQTMDKDHAEEYYYFSEVFYRSVLEDLPEHAQVFYAVKDARIIAASIFLMANGKMNYHLSGSLKEFSGLAPTNLILYKAALWGCANGYKTLHLGGGVGSGEDGLFKFKRSFYKGDLFRFHIGKKVYNQELYEWLFSLRNDSMRGSFFPAYRG